MPNLQAKIKPFSVCNRRCWRKNHRQLSELTARYFQLSISSTTLITSLLQTCNLRPLQQLHAGFSILCHQNLPRNVFGHGRVQRSFHARLGSWPWKRKRRKRVVDLLLIWNSFSFVVFFLVSPEDAVSFPGTTVKGRVRIEVLKLRSHIQDLNFPPPPHLVLVPHFGTSIHSFENVQARPCTYMPSSRAWEILFTLLPFAINSRS